MNESQFIEFLEWMKECIDDTAKYFFVNVTESDNPVNWHAYICGYHRALAVIIDRGVQDTYNDVYRSFNYYGDDSDRWFQEGLVRGFAVCITQYKRLVA